MHCRSSVSSSASLRRRNWRRIVPRLVGCSLCGRFCTSAGRKNLPRGQRQPFGFDQSAAALELSGDPLQCLEERVVAVHRRVLMVVPGLDHLPIDVRLGGFRAQREVVAEQRGAVIALQQEQATLAGGKTERMDPKVGQIVDVSRIGDQQPLDLRVDRLPEAPPSRQATVFGQHPNDPCRWSCVKGTKPLWAFGQFAPGQFESGQFSANLWTPASVRRRAPPCSPIPPP